MVTVRRDSTVLFLIELITAPARSTKDWCTELNTRSTIAGITCSWRCCSMSENSPAEAEEHYNRAIAAPCR
jgi:hypothetical protein